MPTQESHLEATQNDTPTPTAREERSAWWLRFAVLIGLIGLAAAARALPHPHNVTPIGGLALFAGACFLNHWARWFVPAIAMLMSDIVLGHEPAWVVYGSMAVYVGLGAWLLRDRDATRQPLRIGGVTLMGSLQFFLVTNFAVWLGAGMYPQNFAGLLACYEAALPFFKNTLIGDLATVTALFGAFAVIEVSVPALRDRATVSGV